MRTKKIIHLTKGAIYGVNFYQKSDNRFYTASWANTLAEKLYLYNTNHKVITYKNIEFECWRHEPGIEEIEQKIINGVKVRLFPARYDFLLGVDITRFKSEMKEEQKKSDLVIHFHGIYDLFVFNFCNTFKKCPIILTNHGSRPPFINKFNNIKRYSKRLLMYLYLRRTLKNIDYINPAGNDERYFLKRLMESSKVSPYYVLGVDFNRFIPMNKQKIREKLNIDNDSFVIAYTGSLYKLKGFDIILDVFKELKKQFKTDLICIGASRNDKYYDSAKKMGAIIFEKNYDTLDVPFVLNSADVFLNLTYKNTKFLISGGMGIASIEAMACDIPVVSFALRHFPNINKVKEVGILPKNIEDIVPSILRIKNKEIRLKNIRSTAIKYLN